MPPPPLPENDVTKPQAKTNKRKPGGWKSMPYILGNESFERLASIGLVANFTVFLMTVFHMDQVSSSNLINIWSGVTNFAPLVGAFISDAYVGKFWVIAVSSFATLTAEIGRYSRCEREWEVYRFLLDENHGFPLTSKEVKQKIVDKVRRTLMGW